MDDERIKSICHYENYPYYTWIRNKEQRFIFKEYYRMRSSIDEIGKKLGRHPMWVKGELKKIKRILKRNLIAVLYEPKEKAVADILDVRCKGYEIDCLNLSVRSYNCLKRAGINTIFDLEKKKPEELLKIRNLGKRSYNEIMEAMKRYMI